MSTFLDAVNRLLRLEGIIRGDDDTISDFTSTQHSSSIEFAKIALQDELSNLTDSQTLPFEQGIGTVTFVTDTRLYSLPTDFQRFTAEPRMYLIKNAAMTGSFIVEKPESEIRIIAPDYQTNGGTPSWFYFPGATTMQIGMYPIPNSGINGDVYRFWYDKTQSLSAESDTVPLITTNQFNAFTSAAGRRFKFLRLAPDQRDALFPGGLEQDPVLGSRRSSLYRLLRMTNPTNRYGRRYG